MKIIILILAFAISANAYSQVVKDPFLQYYKSFDDPKNINPATKIYYFSADFTGDGKQSVFIATDLIAVDKHGNYSWTVFYPLSSGGYKEITDDFEAHLSGPSYIGYIKEIKKYGIVTAGGSGGQMIVFAYFLSKGNITWKWLGHDLDSATEAFPQYFSSAPNWNIQTYTLAQLAQKYPTP